MCFSNLYWILMLWATRCFLEVILNYYAMGNKVFSRSYTELLGFGQQGVSQSYTELLYYGKQGVSRIYTELLCYGK